MASQRSSTKSESPVAAREQLDAREQNTEDNLEQQAKEQEREQRDELKAGRQAKSADKSKEVAEAPAAVRGTSGQGATQGGFMDQMSRRSGADALEGHYVTIDLNYKGVADAYEAIGLEEHTGNYGVYLEVGSVRDDGTGIPETAVVRLRDNTHAIVAVPYEALSPSEPRGR